MDTGFGSRFRLGRRSLLLGGAALVAGCAARRPGPAATFDARGLDGSGAAGQVLDAEQALRAATGHFADKCARLWGGDNVKLPTAKTWVSYNEDWTSRGEIDFENGAFTAEALIDADAAADALDKALAELRRRVEDAATDTPADLAKEDDVARLADALTGRPASTPPASVAPPPAPAAPAPVATAPAAIAPAARETPLLAGLLPENAAARLDAGALERKPVTGEDGRRRVMLTYRVPIKDGYFLALAARYAEPVRRETRRHGLAPSLVYAVIETESAFNPRARSPVPAYGLMQLVPRTAGRDAHAFVHGVAGEPDPDTLYDPAANIALGAAYLKILGSRYLSAIADAESRIYATIAAYNTGAGNVARAFDGTTRIGTAARLINALPPDEVLRRLKAQLPQEETRRYVVAVLERQDRYRGLDEPEPPRMLAAAH